MLDRGRSQGRSRATLVLEDGAAFQGWSFASEGDVAGEVVFTTSMVGYQETITDPSYRGQILLFTYPLIGNYGVIPGDDESPKVQATAVLGREYTPHPSNWASERSLADLLDENGVLGIEGIDTRALTRQLSVKGSIYKELRSHGASVLAMPGSTRPDDILAAEPDGLFLSNGPGDPAALGEAVNTLRPLLGELPTFGICLGHQLIGLALSCETYKMPFGHHGANHPVRNLRTGGIEITSQNHGFAVREETLPGGVEMTHRNLYDGTVEGIESSSLRAWSVQYHPESSPGPRDSGYLFDEFVRCISEKSTA